MNPSISFTPGLMGEPAAAFYLGISTSKLNALQAQGRLIPKKLDGKRGFARIDLDEFIESLPDWGADRDGDSAS